MISKNSNKFAVTVALWKLLYKSLFSIHLKSFHSIMPKKINRFRLAIQNVGKTLYSIFETHSWKNFKQVDSDSCIKEKNIEITIFQLFGKLPLNIA